MYECSLLRIREAVLDTDTLGLESLLSGNHTSGLYKYMLDFALLEAVSQQNHKLVKVILLLFVHEDII